MLQSSDHDSLQSAAERLRAASVADLLTQAPTRVDQLKIEAASLQLDASKQLTDDNLLNVSARAAHHAGLTEAYEQLTTGAEVNVTEQRPALHTLLRGTASETLPDA